MHERELLRAYIEQASQPAFAALIERYSGLVYSTCLRELGDATLAEDVTQVVFLLLAEKAASIRADTSLSSWLFQTACFASKNAAKQEKRRRQREEKATKEMMQEQQVVENEAGWDDIQPHLNDALRHLKEEDRQAILLRFFDGKNLQEVGAEMGVSEEAARKRVTRAVEKLRKYFARYGLLISAPLLIGLVSANAVQAAPAHCVQAILSASTYGIGGGAVSSAMTTAMTGTRAVSLWQGASKALLLGKVYVTMGTIAGIGMVCAGVGAVAHLQRSSSPVNNTVHSTPTGVRPTQKTRLIKNNFLVKNGFPPPMKPRQPISPRPRPEQYAHYSLTPLVLQHTVSSRGEVQATVVEINKGAEMIRSSHPATRPISPAFYKVATVTKVTPATVAKAVIPLLILLPLQQAKHADATPWSLSVVDENGKPVKAHVRIARPASAAIQQLETDATGHLAGDTRLSAAISINSLADVFIFAEGHAPAGGGLRPGENLVRLGTPRTLSGYVFDDKGKPLAGVAVQLSGVTDGNINDNSTLENSVQITLLPQENALSTNYITTARRSVTQNLSAQTNLLSQENALFAARTDATGRYTLQNLPVHGTALITVCDVSWRNVSTQVDLAEQKEAPDMKTRPAARLSGRVLRPDGKPAAHKILYARSLNNYSWAETDAEGRYVLGGLASGKASIIVMGDPQSDPGIAPITDAIAVVGTETAVPDIRMEPGVLVEIKTTPAVSGGNFNFSREGASVPASIPGSMTILEADNGVIRARVRPGTYYLAIVQPPAGWLAPRDWPTAGLKIEASEIGANTAKIHLDPALTLEGIARDAAGKPLAGVSFRASRYGLGTVTDAGGHFTLHDLKPGKNALSTGSAWDIIKTKSVVLPAAQPVEVTLTKANLTALSGRVVDDKGGPIENAAVTVAWTEPIGGDGDSRNQQRQVRTNADGRYEMPALRTDAEISLKAAKPKHRFMNGGEVTIARTVLGVNGAPVPNPNAVFTASDIVLQSLEREVSGRVVDAKGKPVANAFVAALGGGQGENSGAPRNIARTDGDGRFILRDLPDGDLGFVAGAGDGFVQIQSKSATLGDLVLQPQARPARDVGLARRIIVDLAANANRTYSESTRLAVALVPYDFQGAIDAANAMQPDGKASPNVLRMVVSQLIRANPEAARETLPPMLPDLERDANDEGFLSFLLDVSQLLPQPQQETLPGETGDTATLRAWLRRNFIQSREKMARVNIENASDFRTAGKLASLAALDARLGEEADATRWVKSAVQVAARLDTERQYSWGMAAVAKGLARGGTGLLEKNLDAIPLAERAFALNLAIPGLARTDLAGARHLLALSLSSASVTASENIDDSIIFGHAAKAIITRMKAEDAAAALTLARTVTGVPGDSSDAEALVLAARLQPKTAVAPLLREAFDMTTNNGIGKPSSRVAAMALTTDEAVGEELLKRVEDTLFEPKPLWQAEARVAPAFYLAQAQPGRARAWIERLWKCAQNPADGSGRPEQLTSIALAMSAVDTKRALDMAAAIPPQVNPDGSKDSSAQWEAQRKIAQFLAAPEGVRRSVDFDDWATQNVLVLDEDATL